MLGLGVLLISTAGVQCFAISESRKDNKIRPRALILSPIACASNQIQVAGYSWGRNTLCRLFANKDDDESNKQLPVDSASNVNAGIDAAESMQPTDDATKANSTVLSNWPCFDQLDRELIRISIPVIGNYAINPLIGAVDLFWVNRMGNALAVAGQAAANQVFSSAFWFTSFLPSGKTIGPHLRSLISI